MAALDTLAKHVGLLKVAALDTLAKHVGLLKERIDVDQPMSIQIVHTRLPE